MKKSTANKTGIPVKNAGIVLLNSYIPILFDRLGLLTAKTFQDLSKQENSIHYLQFLVTGLDQTEESFLPLNKVICGWPIAKPISEGITITDENRKMMEGLINAAKGHWPAAGESSINGFRGNWLERDGLLTEHDDKWELVVEKRAYDILIEKSPFSFSIIKFSWMGKPLHVTWP